MAWSRSRSAATTAARCAFPPRWPASTPCARRPVASPRPTPFLESLLAIALPLDGPGYAAALAERHAIAAQWSTLFARHPVILAPVSTEPPWPVGHDLGGPSAVHDEWWGFRLTVATSALGLPALSLPDGTQLIAGRWNEPLLLQTAARR